MNFNFKDVVKFASKGIKPSEIAELAALDENKFDKDDILSLIGSGYKTSDIKNLVETFSDPEESEDDLGDDAEEKDDHSKKSDTKSSHDDHEEDTSDEADDNIDYKELYEKEKKLRQKLQQNNQKAGSSVKTDDKSDFDIALEIANSI